MEENHKIFKRCHLPDSETAGSIYGEGKKEVRDLEMEGEKSVESVKVWDEEDGDREEGYGGRKKE